MSCCDGLCCDGLDCVQLCRVVCCVVVVVVVVLLSCFELGLGFCCVSLYWVVMVVVWVFDLLCCVLLC